MTNPRDHFAKTAFRSLLAGTVGMAFATGFVPFTPMQPGIAQAHDLVIPGMPGTAKQTDGGGHDGGGNGNGGAGGNGNGNGGNGGGSGGSGGHDDGGHDGSTPPPDGEGTGGGSDNGQGAGGENRPDWAQEGIPEVELGRLNVARSPDHVLDRALEEMLANLTPEQVALLNASLPEIIDRLTNNFDELALIDSPLENLAMLRELLDGTSPLSSYGVTNDDLTLMAVAIGLASDKTIPVTVDTVVALTTILGTPVTGDLAEQLAAMAESVREAALAGHG